MQLFHHPTSIAIIDDDQYFLESISFYLSDDFLCKTFNLPEQALLHILKQEEMREQNHRFFTDPDKKLPPNALQTTDRLIQWEANKLYNFLETPQRFEELSIAVIDYDMPGMNGLELCRQIADYPLKKILLTGKTGTDTVINAFNEGIIDCYLMKQDNNLTEKLHYEILRLQKRYFNYVSNQIKPIRCLENLNFLDDPAFENMFENIIHTRHIDEFYISTSPNGMLLVHKDGNICFLTICKEEQYARHISYAEKLNAPAQLISMLRNQQILTMFPTSNGYYSPELEKTWNEYIWPTQKLEGKNTNWFFCLIEDESLPHSLYGKVFSYEKYVDMHM